MCLRGRVQVSKKKVEKSRLILSTHPYANATNAKSPSSSSINDLSPSSRAPPARTPLAPTALRSPAPNHSPNHVRTLATTPASLPTIETLTSDVGSKWARPLHSLPIAGDFPRLARVTSLFVGPDLKPIVPEASSPSPPSLERVIYDTLIMLAIYLHDPTTLQSTKEHFWDYHKEEEEGEVARHFGLFLKSCLHDGDNVCAVLKSINQAILAPAVIALKMSISSLPFKDYGNSWRVKVLISADDFVEIVHIRREQSFNPQQGEAMKFEFVWELSIRISLRNTNTTTNTNKKNEEERRKSNDFISGINIESPTISESSHSPRNEQSSPSSSSSPSQEPLLEKNVTNVTLQIVEIAFGMNVPPENKEKVLGDMKKLTSNNCVITTIVPAT